MEFYADIKNYLYQYWGIFMLHVKKVIYKSIFKFMDSGIVIDMNILK